MATRSGTVDPGLILWLYQHSGLAVSDIAEALEVRDNFLEARHLIQYLEINDGLLL